MINIEIPKKTRLDVLEEEREQIKNMRCLSFNLIEECVKYYEHEIDAIRLWGSSNPVYEEDKDYILSLEEECENLSEQNRLPTNRIKELENKSID